MNRTYLTLGDTGRPGDRVIRIVNLHYEADGKDVHKVLDDEFTVIDFMRGVNPRINKNTIGYVLLATEQARIDAQALSGGKILDREVKVIPEQVGFRISLSGDKLLPPFKGEHADTSSAGGETREDAPPAVGDVDAFPSLGMAATPRLAATMPARLSTRKQPAQQRALQNRLLFLNNIGQGPEINETSSRLYFGKYLIVDVKRPLDPRTDTPHPTAFVVFASVEDRDAALQNLKGIPMHGRKVTLEVPKTFQNVDEQGFVPSANENVVIFSTFPRDCVVNAAPPAPFLGSSTREGLQTVASSVRSSASNDITADLRHLLGRLGMTESDDRHGQNVEASCEADDSRQAHNSEVTWGVAREQLRQRHQAQQQTLAPMPSGVEGPGQIVEGRPFTPHRFYSPHARPASMTPRGRPPGINTDFNPEPYKWAINVNQNPASHVIREDEWHGGQEAIEQRLRKNETQSTEPAVAHRINTEGDIAEDDKIVEGIRE